MKRYDQNTSIQDSVLREIYKQTHSPIRDGRIVGDRTFAMRLYKFLEGVEVQDLPSEEERDYLLGVAKRLLNHQIATAQTSEETEYLKRNGYGL